MSKNNKLQNTDHSLVKEIEKWLQYPVNRREFVRGGALAVGLSLGIIHVRSQSVNKYVLNNIAGNGLTTNQFPLVTFGGTGVKVPVLGLGSQTMGENQDKIDPEKLEESALDIYGYAMDNGVTYIDSAGGYGRAEEFIGKTIQSRKREDLFITTKVWADSYDAARNSFERSLQRLGTDYIDLLYIHSAGDRNIENILKKPSEKGYDPALNGAWSYLEEQKIKGKAKFLGITAHSGGERLQHLVEQTHDPSNQRENVDAIMVRMSYVSHNWGDFHKIMGPLVKKYNLGAMIMKVFGGPAGFGKELNQIELREAVRYVRGYDWAHGVVIGGSSRTQIDQNINWVNQTPMTPEEMETLRSIALASNALWKKRFANHVEEKYRFFG